MAIIKAPYNFVPLEEIAFYPEWANHISQDIPFEDGVSGRIEYTITAKTPIYVRNGQKQEDKPENRDNTFSHTSDGKYFIPGTSIKGEIRSVLEILSFGKMTQVQDSRFGIRDLGAGPEGARYRNLIKNVFCGWLKKDGDKYILEDCGKPGRISPEEIDRHFHSSLKDFDLNLRLGTSNTGNSKEDDEKLRSSYKKYDLLNLITSFDDDRSALNVDCLEGKFQFDAEDDFGKKFYKYDNQGEDGTLILTGQPSKRRQDQRGNWTGKYYEFIFFAHKKTIQVDGNVIDDFLTIHKNNYDFKHLWRDRLNFGERIPVFYIKDDKYIVQAIGLAYMFRYPTANFIKGAIPASLQSSCHKDLAECMFGTESECLGALKGRVFFSSAFAEGQPQCLELKESTLSSPKASFGPLYVKGGTWDDSNARIKGRKRYPVRNNVWNNEQGNEKTSCRFIPLKEGTKFTGTVRFHNLKIEEYGALLAALTFNGHNECSHSIGEAKPLGYGKVKIDITKIDAVNIVTDTRLEKDTALDSFRDMMSRFYPQWETSNSLTELYAMAKGIPSDMESNFTYLKMSTTDDNEFKSVKDEGENMAPFTVVTNPENKKQKPVTIERNPKICINLRSSLNEQIKAFDKKYTSDILEKQAKDLKIKTAILNIRDCLTNGELLKAKDLINVLDKGITEKAILEEELSTQIQAMEQRATKLYDSFIASYTGITPEEALDEADQIISEYAVLIALSPAELKYVERKQKLEQIKQWLIAGPTLARQTLTKYYETIPLNSIAAFAGRLKKWMDAQGVTEISVSQAIELGQIVKDKSESLKSSDKKTWKDRKKWIPVLKIIGEEKTDLAFNAAFN